MSKTTGTLIEEFVEFTNIPPKYSSGVSFLLASKSTVMDLASAGASIAASINWKELV